MSIQALIESKISAGVILDEPAAADGGSFLALDEPAQAEDETDDDTEEDPTPAETPTPATPTSIPTSVPISVPNTRLGVTPRVFGTATVKRQRLDDLIKTTAQKIDAPDPFLLCS